MHGEAVYEEIVLTTEEEIREQFENWHGVVEDLWYPVEEIEKAVGIWNKKFGAWEQITVYYKNGEKQVFEFEW